jgi:DNA-binding Lrp family transcriptional regulator
VEEVFEVSGEFDIEVRLAADNIVQLNERLDRIRSIKGVAGTRTRLILRRYS